MDSHDTGFVFTQKSWLGHTPRSFSALKPQTASFFVEQSYQTGVTFSCLRPRTPQPSSALNFPSDSIWQGIPTCLFLEKTISVLSYSFGIFHSSLTSSLGKVGLRFFKCPCACTAELRARCTWGGWMPLRASVPHFHLSSLLTRNLVFKITHSLHSELKLRAAFGGRLWI